MQKLLPALFIAFLSVQAMAQDTALIVSKAPVLPASAADNQQAIESANQVIKNTDGNSLFNSFFLVGPRLWDKIKNEPSMQPFEDASNLTLRIPKFDKTGNWSEKEEVKGKVIQAEPDYATIWSFIKKHFNISKAVISPLTNRDKFFFWLYFAKIEEPVLVLQSGQTRLLLKFTNGKLFFADITSD